MDHMYGLVLSIHVLIVVLNFNNFVLSSKPSKPQVPCYFIFGDSMVDNGNNNKLKTKCKVNYPPYGIDFPENVTGRFTNGRTSADVIGEFLGFSKFIPSYSTASNDEISRGVNYGSGCAGILKKTGTHLGNRISLDRQLRRHKSVVSRLFQLRKKMTLLKKCIYVINIGSNDYINNYFRPDFYNSSELYTKDQYADVLIKQYSRQLKTLYSLGARKIVVFGLAKSGCSPAQIDRFGTDGRPCVQRINDAVELFNNRLMPLVLELNNNKTDARFTFINLTSILTLLGDVHLPSVPCCQVRNDWQCIPNSVPFPIRSMCIFFDGTHPTEVSNIFIATRSYKAVSVSDAYPYDINHLAQL
ncbi:SGNH hydrolase-type esterase domain-containing protein [Artemisia annua]|uniref:SGNH hydrolase-type esterase domain-containing protein n=1 Tax=Artemisia annua TaxID=35608 RepID=A0A2U1NLS3_ARTAN|nr:SGNH hydrolase-type esterase domain-containing protein [Artemisia annua]